jgi:anaphase-promoting complex subunit 7
MVLLRLILLCAIADVYLVDSMSVPNALDTLTSGLASMARLPFGVTAIATQQNDGPRLTALYDVENSRECRAVRERITELDLVVEKVIPTAENSRVFLDPSYEYALPAGTSIPRLEVEDSGEKKILSGTQDIISYLDKSFDDDSTFVITTSPDEQTKEKVQSVLTDVGSYVAGWLRLGRGNKVCSAASATSPLPVPRPTEPLILYSYEGNQFCRLVREVLSELDLVYELRSAGKASPRREEMAKITGGSSQCPYLIDSNTGVSMFECVDIVAYLYKTYARWTPPSEILEGASRVVTPLFKPVYKVLAPLQAGSYKTETSSEYETHLAEVKEQIQKEIRSDAVVIYTYSLSPFCTEATALLDNLGISYTEISLGMEWIPGLLQDPLKRAALGEMTGQTSLPNVFIGGKSIGGLFSGTPGLVPSLEEGTLMKQIEAAKNFAGANLSLS